MGLPQSILRRVGIRQLPGMCRHPASAQGRSCEHKVAPRISPYSSLAEAEFCQGLFYFRRKCYDDKTMAMLNLKYEL